MNTDKQNQSKVFVAPKRRHDEVYEAYVESDRHWDDSLAVVYSSPLRRALFDATERYAKYFPKHGQIAIDNSVTHTIIKAQTIISKIVNDAVAIFDEWDTEPQPDTVFKAYQESEAIWDAYEWFLNYSPLHKMRNWMGMTFPTTWIGKWATLKHADVYLVSLNNLIKDILEHALDAFADSMEPADRQDYDYWH